MYFLEKTVRRAQMQDKPEFKPYDNVILKDMLDLNSGERIAVPAVFMRYLTHLHWKGHAEIRIRGVFMNVKVERLEKTES